MSSKSKQNSKSPKKKPAQVLVFAEDKHDSDAIKCLVEALNPDFCKGAQIVVQRDPGSLTRHALPDKVQDWMSRIAKIIEVRSMVADVIGVLVHQDSDAPDNKNADVLRSALASNVSVGAYPVVPVQEMETWWFLFPECFRAVKPGAWRDVKFPVNSNVETIQNPKEDLIRRTRSASPKQVYAEADSLAVAQKIAFAIRAGRSPSNTSNSWSDFAKMAGSLKQPSQ